MIEIFYNRLSECVFPNTEVEREYLKTQCVFYSAGAVRYMNLLHAVILTPHG